VAGLGAGELVVILVILLVLFGGAKLPKLAKSIGQAQREFRKGIDEGASDSDSSGGSDAAAETDSGDTTSG